MEMLKLQKYRTSTKENYYGIWKTFNNFFLRLDRKPMSWENRISLFVTFLIKEKRKSLTIKSYVSAIKAVLSDINMNLNEDRCLINSLTRACRINNDTISIRLPIRKELLNLLLKTVQHYFFNKGQTYLVDYTWLFFQQLTMDYSELVNSRQVPMLLKQRMYTSGLTRRKSFSCYIL